MLRKTYHDLHTVLAKNVGSESNHKETDKSKSSIILKSNWPLFFKNVDVMKNKILKTWDN